MNDILDNLTAALQNDLAEASIIPCNNGGIQINVQDEEEMAEVVAHLAAIMYEYGFEDIQLTTNKARKEVYVDIIGEEEYEGEEEWEDDELPLNERPVPIQKGDIICYRMGLVKVLQVLKNGAWVEGPYGEVQTIDWEDIQQYNPNFTQTEKSEEE